MLIYDDSPSLAFSSSGEDLFSPYKHLKWNSTSLSGIFKECFIPTTLWYCIGKLFAEKDTFVWTVVADSLGTPPPTLINLNTRRRSRWERQSHDYRSFVTFSGPPIMHTKHIYAHSSLKPNISFEFAHTQTTPISNDRPMRMGTQCRDLLVTNYPI